MRPQTVRYFSSPPEGEHREFTPEELEKGRQQWGIQYDDECLKFEKEWEKIAAQVEKDQAVYLESELGDLQKAKVEMLVDKALDLNLYEIRYFHVLLSTKV